MNRLIAPLIAAACLAPLGAFAQNATDVLRAADKYRSPSANLQIEVSITTHGADGAMLKDRQYTVFAQSDRRSLVLMKSPAEAGQKVLMIGDEFWLLIPSSARPMRITPMQKLLGDASTGDIATMSWLEDYTAQMVGEESCGPAPCLHLSLSANRKGVTYQKIDLWVGKTKFQPVKADLYVQSEKLAKQATFTMDDLKAPTMVTEMVLTDELGNHKQTRVRYASRKERVLPREWMNPMFLASNPKIDG